MMTVLLYTLRCCLAVIAVGVVATAAAEQEPPPRPSRAILHAIDRTASLQFGMTMREVRQKVKLTPSKDRGCYIVEDGRATLGHEPVLNLSLFFSDDMVVCAVLFESSRGEGGRQMLEALERSLGTPSSQLDDKTYLQRWWRSANDSKTVNEEVHVIYVKDERRACVNLQDYTFR